MFKNSLHSPIRSLRDAFERQSFVHSVSAKVAHILHPNQQTVLRVVPGLCALVPHAFGYPVVAATSATVADILDYQDGLSARAAQKQADQQADGWISYMTTEGARLDPFVDKIIHGTQLLSLTIPPLFSSPTTSATFVAGAAFANVAVDAYSQMQRGSFVEQIRESYTAVVHPEACHRDENAHNYQANFWGKTKFALQSGAIVALFLSPHTQDAATAILLVSATCGAIGTMQRKKKKA